MVTIENGNLCAKISLECGGRIAQLTYKGKDILMSDEKTWAIAPPIPTPHTTDFIQYFGTEAWIGPQKDWWLDQDLNIEQRDSPIKWPPDPYISYGRYTVISRTKNKIEIISEPSKITNLKLTKHYEITENNVLVMTTRVENVGNKEKRLDVWHIMRTPAIIKPETYILTTNNLAVEGPTHEYERKALYKIENNMFSFDTEAMCNDVYRDSNDSRTPVYTAKAFSSNSNGEFYEIICKDEEISVSFKCKKYPAELLDEGATPIEIYSYFDAKNDDGFWESELHSPSFDLAPQETNEFTSYITILQR